MNTDTEMDLILKKFVCSRIKSEDSSDRVVDLGKLSMSILHKYFRTWNLVFVEAKDDCVDTIEKWHTAICRRILQSTQQDSEKMVDDMMVMYYRYTFISSIF